ncbi:flagellar hook-basal body protein [Pontibacillus litoralis]|uniref:Flagellar basal body rod protein subunit C n=1 Tax=Pontibacillus litoralis JSM 072002 TaxID=1385512 RepID=A0A0A5G5R1_9BACI|nr:flagellar hook-basal body protein [Pontibacillus litoralis]KGX86430.1 flagellar basal body rod protein subunit C [Pontibacillus litoralis JSM 072002]
MLRGYYSAASSMLAQQRRQESLSNNLANVNTPGYKADQGSLRAFPEMLLARSETKTIPTKKTLTLPMRSEIGALNTGVYMQEVAPNFSQGDVRETNMTTDVALVNGDIPDENGGLFFTVENIQGETRYTRNGNFTVDPEGYLTTQQGLYVLDENANRIQTDGMEFTISSEGVLTSNGQATPLGIAYTADANQMVKEGQDLFRMEGGQAPVNARGVAGVQFSSKQGFLEGSNVDSGQTMTEMMASYRLFETNQKVLKAYDQSMDKAVNEIGVVR